MRSIELFVASHQLNIISQSSHIQLLPFASKHYITPLFPSKKTWNIEYLLEEEEIKPRRFHSQTPDFSGNAWNNQELPHKWEVYSKETTIDLLIHFSEDKQLQSVHARIDSDAKLISIRLTLQPNIANIQIDPLFHPLGPLLMVYLANTTNGFLIHASGVVLNEVGYAFTAVSGTGKSTMAGLWATMGASIINDDRLWVEKEGEQWFMYNTPMIWYAQQPLKAPINQIFLLHQAPFNQLTSLNGALAAMQVMSNCIQHNYQKNMTQTHLNSILQFTEQTKVYRCQFLPTTDIIQAILEEHK